MLNLYKEKYPTENINNDLFFSQFFESCIKDYIPYTSQPIFEETQDLTKVVDMITSEFTNGL